MTIPEYRSVYNQQGIPQFDCSEPSCKYALTQGKISAGGICACDQTFCEDHFDNHVCVVAFRVIPRNLDRLRPPPPSYQEFLREERLRLSGYMKEYSS